MYPLKSGGTVPSYSKYEGLILPNSRPFGSDIYDHHTA